MNRILLRVSADIACFACSAAILVLTLSACAQGEPEPSAKGQDNSKRSLRFNRTLFREAVKQLFEAAGVSYALNISEQDLEFKKTTITALLYQVPFDSALEQILKASPIPLEQRFEKGIY